MTELVKILGGSKKSMIQLWFVMAIPPRGCRVEEGERDQLDGVGLGVPVLHGGLVVPYALPGCEQRLAP